LKTALYFENFPPLFLLTNYMIFKTHCLTAQCLILLSDRTMLDITVWPHNAWYYCLTAQRLILLSDRTMLDITVWPHNAWYYCLTAQCLILLSDRTMLDITVWPHNAWYYCLTAQRLILLSDRTLSYSTMLDITVWPHSVTGQWNKLKLCLTNPSLNVSRFIILAFTYTKHIVTVYMSLASTYPILQSVSWKIYQYCAQEIGASISGHQTCNQ